MKKIIFILVITLTSLSYSQTRFGKGIKLYNALEETDFIFTDRMPLMDENGLINSFISTDSLVVQSQIKPFIVLSDLDNYMTLNTEQTVTEDKLFNSSVSFNSVPTNFNTLNMTLSDNNDDVIASLLLSSNNLNYLAPLLNQSSDLNATYWRLIDSNIQSEIHTTSEYIRFRNLSNTNQTVTLKRSDEDYSSVEVTLPTESGKLALLSDVTISIGDLTDSQTSLSSIYIGTEELPTDSRGDDNVIIGIQSIDDGIGDDNVIIGKDAGSGSGSDLGNQGHRNVFLGKKAGELIKGATDNVFIGFETGKDNQWGDRNILLGSGINNDGIADSDKLNIGNLIKGDLVTGEITLPNTDIDIIQDEATGKIPITKEYLESILNPEVIIIGNTGAPVFENGWENFSTTHAEAGFFKIGNIVHLKGLVSLGTANTIFTLPEGYRPPRQLIISILSNSQTGRLDIGASGIVNSNGINSNAWVNLSGVSFIVD